MSNADYTIHRGLYVAIWPDRTISFVYYRRRQQISDLFWDVDAFGNPHEAKVFRASDDCLFDVTAGANEKYGRRVAVEWAERNLTRVRFPQNILEISLKPFERQRLKNAEKLL